MNALEKYNIRQGDWINIDSSICSTASSLSNTKEFAGLKTRIDELILSYFNQWHFVVDAYGKMYQLFFELNQVSDQPNGGNIITDFDIKSLQLELDFKNYSYLFIVSLKSLLDIFACLTDITQNHIARNEDNRELPDFFNYEPVECFL